MEFAPGKNAGVCRLEGRSSLRVAKKEGFSVVGVQVEAAVAHPRRST